MKSPTVTPTVPGFARAVVPELERSHLVMVHAEDCIFNAATQNAGECTCWPVRVYPGDPRPMATILAGVIRAQRWH